MKGTAKYLGGVLLAAGLLWWVLRGTDDRLLWEYLKQASIPGMLLAALLSIGHNVFRVLRWRALLEPVRPGIPFRPMFDAVILGYMTTWLIPGRLGELVRPALLSSRERIPLGPCLGSVVADRVLDGIAVLVLFGAGIALAPAGEVSEQLAPGIRNSALVMVGVIAVPLALLLWVSRSRARLEQRFAGRAGLRGWFGRTLIALSTGVEALKRPALLLRVALYSLGAWLVIALAIWVGLRAIGVEVSFAGSLILQPLLVFGIALPTPGGAGGYHAAMRIGLIQLFGVNKSLAVGAGLVTHAAMVLPVILVGGILLVVDRMPFQELLQAARQVRSLGSAAEPAEPTEKLS